MVNSGAALRIAVRLLQKNTFKNVRGLVVRRAILALMSLSALAPPAAALLPDPTAPIATHAVASTDDGADYVWTVFCRSGLSYSYIPASQFPLSPRFEEVARPQTGDIAWWPSYVGIYVAQNTSVITARGYAQVAAFGGSGPRFFRMRVMQDDTPGRSAAPGTCERNLHYTQITPLR